MIYYYLKLEKGQILDPYQDADRLPWNNLGTNLNQRGMYLESFTVFQSLLNRYYVLQQDHQQRIHKGTPLQYLGITSRFLRQYEQARKYHILAFIEDVISTSNVPDDGTILKSHASIVLLRTYRMRERELLSLQNAILEHLKVEAILYPETMLIRWMQKNEKKQGMLVARNKEERLYQNNLPYLAELKRKTIDDKTGVTLELLAAYLFSCVDGFEPILRKKTEAFHFDLLVRNLVHEHLLLANLGEYIGVECKNINKIL